MGNNMIKTVSLETAKRLKEAGFRQDKSSFYSVYSGDNRQKGYEGYQPHWMIVDSNCASARRNNTKNEKWPDEQIAMPNTDELLEELPKILNGFEFRITGLIGDMWDVSYWEIGHKDERIFENFMNKLLPEALAQMWLHLKKEGLLCQ